MASACRSSLASVWRRWTRTLAVRSKTAILAFPSRFAWYMAASASRRRDVGESAPLLTVTPTLAVTWNSCSPTCIGARSAAIDSSASARASSSVFDAGAHEDELVAADPSDDVVVA